MVKRASECKLNGDEACLEALYNEGGPEAVDHFVTSVNNAMDASEGFEQYLCESVVWTDELFYAPIFNTSVAAH
jgi:hypothetical protein